MEIIPDELFASDFVERVQSIASLHPHLSVKAAVTWAEDPNRPIYTGYTNNTPMFGNWVFTTCPNITELGKTQKIYAIKELRALTFCGLKEAKDAVEYALDLAEGKI